MNNEVVNDSEDEESDDETFVFEEGLRYDIAGAARTLLVAFENCEKAHRRNHGMSGDKKPFVISFAITTNRLPCPPSPSPRGRKSIERDKHTRIAHEHASMPRQLDHDIAINVCLYGHTPIILARISLPSLRARCL